jgi:hypothetical protein
MGVINIFATDFIENASGSIIEDGGEIVNLSEAKVVQNGAKGIDYDKNKDRKPPTDIRITKVEGPFDDKGKIVDKIVLGTFYVYKATTSRKPTVTEIGLLKWSVKFDDGERLIINGVASLNKLDGDKIIIQLVLKHDFEKAKIYAFYQKAEDGVSVELSLKKIKFPILIIQGKHKKGKNDDNTATAPDLLYGDYPENEVGIERLRKELYYEEYNKSLKTDNKDWLKTKEETADLLAKKLSDLRITKIRQFLKKDNEELFSIFRDDMWYFASGNIKKVAQDMVDMVKANKGGEYLNPLLTEAVIGHEKSEAFIKGVQKVIKNFIISSKGSIDELEITDDKNGILYQQLIKKKVDRPIFHDKISGLGITINDVWAYQVYITSYKMNGNNYDMNLEFIYWDHFGLDNPDIHKFDNDIFSAWFILQHFRSFKPLITKIDITHKFTEKL